MAEKHGIEPLYLFVCDYYLVDQRNKLSFFGQFTNITVERFPGGLPIFFIMFAGRSASMAGKTVTVRFTSEDGSWQTPGLANTIDPGGKDEFDGVSTLIMPMQGFEWPFAGNFYIQAEEDDRILLRYPIRIIQGGQMLLHSDLAGGRPAFVQVSSRSGADPGAAARDGVSSRANALQIVAGSHNGETAAGELRLLRVEAPFMLRGLDKSVQSFCQAHRLTTYVPLAETLVRRHFPEAAKLRWELERSNETGEHWLAIWFNADEGQGGLDERYQLLAGDWVDRVPFPQNDLVAFALTTAPDGSS